MKFLSDPLLKPFKDFDFNTFPQEAIESLIENQHQSQQILLDAFTDFITEPDDYSVHSGNYLHVISFVMLAYFKEKDAWYGCRKAIEELSTDREYDNGFVDIFDCINTTAFGRMIGALGREHTEELIELVINEDIEPCVRASVSLALQSCYLEGDLEKDNYIQTLDKLFDSYAISNIEGDEQEFVWSSLIQTCATANNLDLVTNHFHQIPKNLKQYDKLVEVIESIPEGDELLPLNQQEREFLRKDLGYFNDPLQDIKEWQLPFDPYSEEELLEAMKAAFTSMQEASNTPITDMPNFSSPIVRESPKVGRNDPCPCNSGKKFKKCCGKN